MQDCAHNSTEPQNDHDDDDHIPDQHVNEGAKHHPTLRIRHAEGRANGVAWEKEGKQEQLSHGGVLSIGI